MSAENRPSLELIELSAGHSDGTLSDEQLARLEQLLLADASARAYFRRYLALDAALRDHGENSAEHWLAADTKTRASQPATRGNRGASSWAKRLSLAAAAAVALVIGIVAALALVERAPATPSVIASLEQFSGNVRIVAADGAARPSAAGARVHAGDTIRTSGDESGVALAFADGTRLTLVGDTSATCGDPPGKSFVVHHGTLAASVEPQPPRTPMVLATPTARVEVLGTKFVIEAAAKRTDLRVTEGRVRLVRVRDGEAVEVAGGKQAVVTERQKLVVEDIPALSDSWEADFEDGRAAGWEVGQLVTEKLPEGSRGALRTVVHDAEDGETYYSITTESAWSHGLFAPRENSHLHLTFKMDQPSWLNLFFCTRTADPENPRFCSNFLFNKFPKVAAGEWLTISIPLKEFRKLDAVPETLEEVVPYKLIINSTADRGLVVDRVWVTPDGPGKVEVREVK